MNLKGSATQRDPGLCFDSFHVGLTHSVCIHINTSAREGGGAAWRPSPWQQLNKGELQGGVKWITVCYVPLSGPAQKDGRSGEEGNAHQRVQTCET